MGDYYDLLGLERDASPEEIRDAYFEIVRTAHPDTNPSPDANETFLEIQEAYEVLRDSKKRRAYDRYLPVPASSDPLIKINVKMSKSSIAPLNEPQLIYALVDIECLARNEKVESPQTHFCFVIDRSTSMQGNRMDMVKANFNRILPKIRPSDLISIVTFSDRPNLVCASAPIGQIDHLEQKIDQIQCSGGTEIYQGLKAGVDLLWLGGIQNPIRHLILLTDGHTYGDEEACYELARKSFDQGIVISAMGIGHEWNDVFLDKLTSFTGGSTLFVTSEEDLYNYLSRQIDSCKLIYAANLTYEFTSDPGVSLKSVFRLYPEIMPLEKGTSIPLGDISFGSKSQYLFEFILQPVKDGPESVHLSKGRVKMEVYSDKIQKAKVKLDLNVKSKETAKKENPPIELVKALAKLTLYQMQEKTSQDVGDGEFISAVKRMHYLASKMLSRGDRDMARRILMEAEQINKDHRYSTDGEKQVKYGTRGLFLLPEAKSRIS